MSIRQTQCVSGGGRLGEGGGAVVGGPGLAGAGGEVAVEEPDGHFEMAQGAGLAGAGLQAALDGGADFHVLEMKGDELGVFALEEVGEIGAVAGAGGDE